MANLEALSNEELHRELLKHGFPNMPVTSTTRKVLVKKLQLKLDNGTPKSNRRETIDVTKFSSDEEPEEVVKVTAKKEDFNRRRTVGGEKLTNVNVSAGPNKRRSGRVTPLADTLPVKRQTPVPVPEFAEESDEDEIRLVIEHRPPSVVADRRSKSKSPSLGKSDTVTTSYKHVPAVATIPECPLIVEDEFEEPDDEEDDFDDEPVVVAPPPIRPEKVENRYQPSTRYSELGESSWQKRRPITVSGGGQTGSYDFEEPLLPKSSTTNYASPSYTGLSSQSRYSTSTSTYRPSTGIDAGFTATGPELDLSKSPYLSSFTRRLSNLKVDPLDSGIRTRRTYGDRPAASRPKTDTLWDNVKHVVLALHRKYKVHFSILLVALVLLLVFVVFFM